MRKHGGSLHHTCAEESLQEKCGSTSPKELSKEERDLWPLQQTKTVECESPQKHCGMSEAILSVHFIQPLSISVALQWKKTAWKNVEKVFL